MQGTFPNDVILAADTVVSIDDLILGKPVDVCDALRMLRLLRGRSHTVVTGVAVRGAVPGDGVVAATVRMRASTDGELETYIASGEPMDKAGAYAVQGLGGDFVESVQGCLETVIGLPLCLCGELLRAAGIEVPPWPACEHHAERISGS